MTTKTWLAVAGTTENWSSGNAWNPTGVPSAEDLAYFDTNVGGVVIDTDVSCSGIHITSNYTGGGTNDGRWLNNSQSNITVVDLLASGKQFDCGTGIYSMDGNFNFASTTNWDEGASTINMAGTGDLYPKLGAELYNFTIASGASVSYPISAASYFSISNEFKVYGSIDIGLFQAIRVIDDCDTYIYDGGTIAGIGNFRMQAPTATHGILTQQGNIVNNQVLVVDPEEGSRLAPGTYPLLSISNTGSSSKTLALDSGGAYVFSNIYVESSTGVGGDLTLSTASGTSSIRFNDLVLTCNDADVIINGVGSTTDWNMLGNISTSYDGAGDILWTPGNGRLIPVSNVDHTITGPTGGYIETLTLNDRYGTTTVSGVGLAGLTCAANTNIDFNNTNIVISGGVSSVGGNWTGLNTALMTVHGSFDLQNMSLLTDTWDLDLVNARGTALGVRISNCDASVGSGVTATNCQDSGNNDSWNFIYDYTTESLLGLLKCIGFGYLEGEAGNALTLNFRETLDPHLVGSSSNHTKSLQNIVSSSTVITAAEHGTTFENTGTGTQTSFTLPAASGGLEYTFINHNGNGLDIIPNTGDQIITASYGAITDSEFYQTSDVGGVLSIVAIDDTTWVATSEIGFWEYPIP